MRRSSSSSRRSFMTRSPRVRRTFTSNPTKKATVSASEPMAYCARSHHRLWSSRKRSHRASRLFRGSILPRNAYRKMVVCALFSPRPGRLTSGSVLCQPCTAKKLFCGSSTPVAQHLALMPWRTNPSRRRCFLTPFSALTAWCS